MTTTIEHLVERYRVPAEPTRPASPWLEVMGLVLLVVPFLGWVVGVVLLPFVLPIAAAIYLAVRLRSVTGKEQRPVELR